MKKTLFLILLCISFFSANAQNRPVTGTVKDAKTGEAIIGANVIWKGTSSGTITDFDGNFTITVPGDKAVLQIAYLGYATQDVTVDNRTRLEVMMQEDAINLNEMVVVGYSTQKKANLTGAVSVVSGEELGKRMTVSLSNALQGIMPGVTIQQTSGEPGADGGTIKIRGVGSIRSNTDPLVLLDGVETPIDQVDPHSVESITVLKDASSASIYGFRSANGVILITTKRGKSGQVKVNYKGTLTTQSATNLPERVSTVQFMEQTNLSYKNLGTNEPYDPALIEEYRNYRADNWNRFETDWKGEILKNYALLTNHTINISGGNEKLSFMGVGNYVHQDGLIDNNSYSRFNLRLNLDAQIRKWLKFSLDANAVQGQRTTPSVSTAKAIINKSLYMPGVLPGINADGTWGSGKNADNPIAAASVGGTSVTKTPDLTVNATITATPVKNLDLIAQYGRRTVTNRGTSFIRKWDYYDRGVYLGQAPLTAEGLTETWNENVRNYYRLQANYKFEINEHTVSAFGGFTAEDNVYTNMIIGKGGFEFPGYEYLSNGTGQPSAVGGANELAIASYYARLNYVYANKYLLEVNGRWDASSRFMRHLRWHLFPSASIGWILTEEKFMKEIPVLSHAKVRASYGWLGNQNLVTNYPAWSVVSPGYSYWFNKELNPGVAIVTMSNPDITWENSTQFDLGLDLGFWNNKLSFTGDYYIRYVRDMLMQFPPPYFQGLNPDYRNAAVLRNDGWEIAINWKSKVGAVNYGISLVLDDVRNKVLDLKGRTYQDFSIMEGYPYNAQWGYRTDGYFQTVEETLESAYFATKTPKVGYVKYVNQNDDNIINNDDMVYLGDAFPHYNFSVNLTASWKNLDALVFIQGVGQRSAYMSGVGLLPFANGSSLFTHQLDSWSKDNRNAAYPILLPEANAGDNFQKSDKWVRNGAYGRLKTVEIGYTLPASLTKKGQIDNVRLFVNGNNLFTVSNFYKGYDPEVSYGGSVGGEFYPVMRTFTFGLDVKF
ncbi:MAG: TonB-dependent receptor [Dysgonamonadaceae bacterium]|jgi:TonB-linked SusC/RagA family outer membrane protein|nr:TonB-dependent receptor [Dysgonamonadaceae bacterium]